MMAVWFFSSHVLSDQEAEAELAKLIQENAEMEERLKKLESSKNTVTKDETDQIKKLHQVPLYEYNIDYTVGPPEFFLTFQA